MMESVEDIPAAAILDGLPWDWETYGEYLDALDRIAQGPQRRRHGRPLRGARTTSWASAPRRRARRRPTTSTAMAAPRRRGRSPPARSASRRRARCCTRVPDGRPVPGTFATPEELLAIADVLGRHGRGVFEVVPALGERDGAELREHPSPSSAWMAEVSRASGRPVTFGLAQSDRRPDLWSLGHRPGRRAPAAAAPTSARRPRRAASASSRPRRPHAVRPVRRLGRARWRAPSWTPARRARRSGVRAAPLAEADAGRAVGPLDAEGSGRALPAAARTRPATTSPPTTAWPPRPRAGASRRPRPSSTSRVETDGLGPINYPFLNQDLDAVAAMLANPDVVVGLADAGAHVGQIIDAGQATFLLAYWVRDEGRSASGRRAPPHVGHAPTSSASPTVASWLRAPSPTST